MLDFGANTWAGVFFLAIAVMVVAGYSIGPQMNTFLPGTDNYLIGAVTLGWV